MALSSERRKLAALERRFTDFLDDQWKLSDVAAFSLAYIRLLRTFRKDLPKAVLAALDEREKQLRGEPFRDSGFDDLRSSTRRQIDMDLRNTNEANDRTAQNRLLFCVFLDTQEEDFFYLTEPMFEFVRNAAVTSAELAQILETEFPGFKR